MATPRKIAELIHGSGVGLILSPGHKGIFTDKDGKEIRECYGETPTRTDMYLVWARSGSGLTISKKTNFDEVMRELAKLDKVGA